MDAGVKRITAKFSGNCDCGECDRNIGGHGQKLTIK